MTTTPVIDRKFGRNRPTAHGPRLMMSRYLEDLGALPTPPDDVDYSGPAMPAISRLYRNDVLGCCVISGIAHDIGVFTAGAAGTPVMFTDEQIVEMYGLIGGYDPRDPSTDQGCSETEALDYWHQHSFLGHPIAGWLTINTENVAEVKLAAFLFENLFFGIELPDEWTQVRESGFVWDAGTPNPRNGHCVVGCGFSPQGIKICTWGMTGTMTWEALARDVIAQSGGELHAVISPETIARATQRAPNGFSWDQLVADFAALGGRVPAAPPAPSRPTTHVTKAQALAAVSTAFDKLTW